MLHVLHSHMPKRISVWQMSKFTAVPVSVMILYFFFFFPLPETSGRPLTPCNGPFHPRTVINKCQAAQRKNQLLGDLIFLQHIFRLPSGKLPAFFRPLQKSRHTIWSLGLAGLKGEQRVRFESSRWLRGDTHAHTRTRTHTLVHCSIYARPISDRKAVGQSLGL